MQNVVLVIHLMLALSIIALVLLQRSEGGGLGMGGGGLGGLATPQTTANILTRATAIFAACFFATSLFLGVLAGTHTGSQSILDQLDEELPGVVQETQPEEPAMPEVPIAE